ncbi:MAG: hypothetical protein LIR35_03760 [Bacteroidota bacterium]|nr:hypothetical protein [Bacteroidota bacterium]
MEINIKQQAFEYLLSRFIEQGQKDGVQMSSFTRLKVLKLLFFTAAVKNENGEDLLDVFNNFYALPNGPVESDIYNLITSDKLACYSFKDFSFRIISRYDVSLLDEQLKKRIDSSFSALMAQNDQLMSYRAEKLVDLSHLWTSWRSSIRTAMTLGKGSYPMNVNAIKNNTQFFKI